MVHFYHFKVHEVLSINFTSSDYFIEQKSPCQLELVCYQQDGINHKIKSTMGLENKGYLFGTNFGIFWYMVGKNSYFIIIIKLVNSNLSSCHLI